MGSDPPVLDGNFPLKQRHIWHCDQRKIPAREYLQLEADMEQALGKVCCSSWCRTRGGRCKKLQLRFATNSQKLVPHDWSPVLDDGVVITYLFPQKPLAANKACYLSWWQRGLSLTLPSPFLSLMLKWHGVNCATGCSLGREPAPHVT